MVGNRQVPLRKGFLVLRQGMLDARSTRTWRGSSEMILMAGSSEMMLSAHRGAFCWGGRKAEARDVCPAGGAKRGPRAGVSLGGPPAVEFVWPRPRVRLEL